VWAFGMEASQTKPDQALVGPHSSSPQQVPATVQKDYASAAWVSLAIRRKV
jgi:hypothetical protein